MLSAVVGDYLAVEGVDVDISWDRRLDKSSLPDDICSHHRLACLPVSSAQQHDLTFQRLASDADAVLLIAPEFEGILLDRVRQAVAVGAQLISPGEALVREASDKLVMARRLDREGVPVPCTALLESQENWPEDITFPAVIKPVDGAGSQDIFEVQDLDQVNGLPAWSGNMIAQDRMAGIPASVAILCGPGIQVPLPPAEQRLSDDGRFGYLGGRVPIGEALADRAQRLASRALTALPGSVGYVGIDLVLGADPTGGEDFVIEVNPRLTTSYVGLRRLCQDNLADAMLRIAGGTATPVSFHEGSIDFLADGQLR